MPSNGWKNTPPLRKSKDLIDRSSSWQNFDTILSWATHFLVFCLADGNVCIFGLAVLFGIARLGNLVFHLDRTWRSFWLFLFFSSNIYVSNSPHNISLCIGPSHAGFWACQPFFDGKWFCLKIFSTDKARPGSITTLFVAPCRVWCFFWRIGKTYPEVVVLDALLRDEVFCL